MIKHCFYKPFLGQYLLTNDAGKYAFLPEKEFKQFCNNELPIDSEYGIMLCDRYFLSNEPEEVFIRKVETAVRESRSYLFRPTSLFIFAVTNRCNNRCVYCQAHGNAKASDMSPEIAKKAVERIAEAGLNHFTIEFQGGEPLVNFRTIKTIVEHTKRCLPGIDVSFALVSNLSLMTEEIADYIAANNISVSTSLDGPKWIHDKNRPMANNDSSYDRMMRGKHILEKVGICIGAIETTTKETLKHPEELIQEYINQGYNGIFIRPLTCMGSAALLWDQIGYTPEEYLEFYRAALSEVIKQNQEGKRITERFAGLFLTKLMGYRAQNYMELRSPCGAAIGQMAITASGDVFTCDEGRMLAEIGDNTFRLGNVLEDGYTSWINSTTCQAVISASLLETLPSCESCVYQPYCGVCPVVNYATEGDFRPCKPHNERCRIYGGILDILMEYLQQEDPSIMKLFDNWARGE